MTERMLDAVHWACAWAYGLAPLVALGACMVGRGATRVKRWQRLIGAAALGMGIGVALAMAYATVGRGGVRWGQALLAGYFATALLLLLRAGDSMLRLVIAWALGLRPGSAPDAPDDAQRGRFVRHLLAGAVRVMLLFGVGIPFVTAVGLTYRAKVALRQTPESQFGFAYEPVSFQSTDGVRLSGWWIPSPDAKSRNGRRTVLICHGLASNKADQLLLARDLVPAGYNVLAFDFRAHGESGGQLTSFGARERCDVLGAVKWVKVNRPDAAERVFGVGVSTGAAALLAAAADDSPEGRDISAVVVYAGFSNLRSLFETMAGRVFSSPAHRYIVALGLPIAGVHAGADLADFSPAKLVDRLWPRPVLFIHGVGDRVVPWEEGEALFRAASPPKDHLWRDRDGYHEPLADDGVSDYVRRFLDRAEPAPVI